MSVKRHWRLLAWTAVTGLGPLKVTLGGYSPPRPSRIPCRDRVIRFTSRASFERIWNSS